MSSGTEDAGELLVVRVGDAESPADVHLEDAPPAALGPSAYAELRLFAEDADEDDAEAWDRVRSLFVTPAAPTPYLLRRWFAPRSLIGRADAFAGLDAWLASGPPVRVMTARGGAGKSSLVWAWLERRLPLGEWSGCLGYSLYQPGSSIDDLVRHLAVYAAGVSPAEAYYGLRPELEAAVLEVLRTRPFLLVVDGLERALVAHHRLPDAEAEEIDLRSFVDPRDGAFVRALTQGPSRLLATSRVLPSDFLKENGEGPAPGIEVCDLEGLEEAEVMALLAELGVDAAAEWVAPAMQAMARIGHHVLLWRALAGVLREEPEALGRIVGGEDDEDEDDDEEGLQERILEEAFDALPERAEQLLSRLASLEFAADIDDVLTLSKPPLGLRRPLPPPHDELAEAERELAKASDRWRRKALQDRCERLRARCAAWEVHRALAKKYARLPGVREHFAGVHADLCLLEARGLLLWDRASNRHDIHPIVRAHALGRLDSVERRAVAELLREHFAGTPAEPDDVSGVPDLRRSLELYRAELGVNDLEGAARVFDQRLMTPLIDRLDARPVLAELLVPLFADGLHAPPRLAGIGSRTSKIGHLADALAELGRRDEAMAMTELGVGFDLEQRFPPNLAYSLLQWGRLLAAGNFPRAALATYTQVHRLLIASDRRSAELRPVLSARGELAAALGRWKEAEADFEALGTDEPITVCCARAMIAFAADDDPEPHLKDAAFLLTRRWLPGRAKLWNLTVGRIAVGDGAYERAEAHLATAVQLARRAGSDAARAYAWLAVCMAETGRPAAAREAIAAANEAAARHGSRIAAILGTAHRSLGEHELAASLAHTGLREAWADGRGYAWFDDMQVSVASLRELGQPVELPPDRTETAPRLACEEAVAKFIAELEAQKA